MLDAAGDIDYPAGYDAVDAVLILGMYPNGVNNGTFTLTFSLPSGISFTTESLDFDAEHNTDIQDAVDSAAGGDFDYPATCDAINSVHEVAVFDDTVTGGHYTLSFTMPNGETFTTANILYSANAATVKTAINTAATLASITDWTNNDINVSGGALTSAALVITFSGNSVKHFRTVLTTVADVDLEGDGTVDGVVETTPGQTTRPAWAALQMLGMLTNDSPDQGDDLTVGDVDFNTPEPGDPQTGAARGNFPFGISESGFRALVDEASLNDDNVSVRTSLLTAFGY